MTFPPDFFCFASPLSLMNWRTWAN